MKIIYVPADDFGFKEIKDVVQVHLSIGDTVESEWSFASIVTKDGSSETLEKRVFSLKDFSQLTIIDDVKIK